MSERKSGKESREVERWKIRGEKINKWKKKRKEDE